MTFRPLTTQNSLGSNFSQVNDMVRQLNREQRTKVFRGPNQVNALVSGKLPNDLGYGIQFSDGNNIPRIVAYIDESNQPVFKISEDGIDVTVATNDQLTFNSQQNVFKIVETDVATIPSVAAASSGSLTDSSIVVDTGVISSTNRSFLAFLEATNGEFTPLPAFATMPGPSFGGYISHYWDAISFLSGGTVNLEFRITNYSNTSISARNVRWFVLQESAS